MYAAEQIATQEFGRASEGYDPAQVRDFLEEVADQTRAVENEWQALQLVSDGTKAGSPVPSVAADDLLSDLGAAVRQVLIAGEETADRLRREAEREADELRASAQGEAETIASEARAQALRTFEETRAQLRADLEEERAAHERVVDELRVSQQRLRDEIGELEERHEHLAERARELADHVAVFVQRVAEPDGRVPDGEPDAGAPDLVGGPADGSPAAAGRDADGVWGLGPDDDGRFNLDVDVDLESDLPSAFRHHARNV